MLADETSHSGDRAYVRLSRQGRCELVVGQTDELHSFPCSLSALINVGLGARTHLASDYGACTLARKPGGVKITVTPWGAEPAQYLVPLTDYAEALARLSEVSSPMAGKISMR